MTDLSSNLGPLASDPFPEPVRPPTPSEQPPSEPVNIPAPSDDIIDPGVNEPIGIPPLSPTDVPPMQEPPGVF